MREIEFRGLSQSLKDEPSEWVYGSLDISINNRMGYPRIIVHDPELHYGSKYVSMPTIGQYTGLTDKNGVKIFEGDIIQVDDDEEIGYTFRGEKAEVYWQKEKTGFRIKYGEFQKNILLKEDTEFYTVCGNIHEKFNLI